MVVAVIDSGMQLNHGDLAGNLWTNPGEIAGNGIDDDDDGYVDDVHGWDFVGDDNLPNDDFGHGTHVAGTLAAVGNNGIGVVGVAYSSRIMPLRVLDGSGQGYVSDAVRAIDYATRHGVRISNNSWGYTGAASQVLYDAIQAAGAAGQLVVTAAGNSSADIDAIPDYPAAYDLPNIISVAATTQDDHLAVFSNYGPAERRRGGAGRAHPEHAAGRLRVRRRHVDGQPARRRRRRAAAGGAPDVDGLADP